MSKYTVKIGKKAQKQLKKMDKNQSLILLSWLKKNLDGTDNPRQHGKGLTGDRSGEWRYRVGDYRILAYIYDEKILIEVVEVGHRNSIYKYKF